MDGELWRSAGGVLSFRVLVEGLGFRVWLKVQGLGPEPFEILRLSSDMMPLVAQKLD